MLLKNKKIKILIISLVIVFGLVGVSIFCISYGKTDKVVQKTKHVSALLGLSKIETETLIETSTDKPIKETTDKYGLKIKSEGQLKELLKMYEEKIPRLEAIIDSLPEDTDQEEIESIKEEIERLKDKKKAVEDRLKEPNLPQEHGTIYYIDYTNGNDASDGLSTGNAWKTIHKFTTTTVRSAGDIGKLRANTTWNYGAAGEATDIVFDEDGTVASRIELRGCDSVDDPWSDGSDVKPIVSFGDAAYQAKMSTDNFWKLENIEFIESTDVNGIFYTLYGVGLVFEDCNFRDSGVIGCEGLYLSGSEAELINCEFKDNLTTSLYAGTSKVYLNGCIFNGGAATTDFGLYTSSSIVWMDSCSFGATTAHDVVSIRLGKTSDRIYARNCNFADATEVEFYVTWYGYGAALFSEDHDTTKGSQKAVYLNGTITRDTGVTHAGGASSSAKVMPTTHCAANNLLSLADDYLAGDFKIWVPASATTITIYMRSEGAWGTYPTAAQLFIQASYLNHAANATRSKSTASTQVLSDATTWVAFTTTFTPAQAGWAYLKINLGKYEASKGIYVDIKPVTS